MNIKEVIKEEILKLLKENEYNELIATLREKLNQMSTEDDYNELWNFYYHKNSFGSEIAKQYVEQYLPEFKFFADLVQQNVGSNQKKKQAHLDMLGNQPGLIIMPTKDGRIDMISSMLNGIRMKASMNKDTLMSKHYQKQGDSYDFQQIQQDIDTARQQMMQRV